MPFEPPDCSPAVLSPAVNCHVVGSVDPTHALIRSDVGLEPNASARRWSHWPETTRIPAIRNSDARLCSPLGTRLRPTATPPSASIRTLARYSAPALWRRRTRYVQTLPDWGSVPVETDKVPVTSAGLIP